jgi:cell division cycle 14
LEPEQPRTGFGSGSGVDGMIEIDPGRLFWTSLAGTPAPSEQTFYFSVDQMLVYEPFFADFGPLNLGQTFRYCKLLEKYLSDPKLAKKRIVHYTSHEAQPRHNAVVLMCLFQVIVQKKSADDACRRFQGISPALLPFRDATCGVCTYHMVAHDVAKGVEKAIQLGWFDYDNFDCEEYDYLERVENGDMTWIVPNKFIAFAGPHSRLVDDEGFPVFTPEKYVPYFQKTGVTLVIRLNNKMYDRDRFTRHGLKHVDLYFVDGSCPSAEIVQRFFEVALKEPGAIAIHCKAGLGRTGTLIGLWCMKEAGWGARAFIGWNRVCRPGSILGPQQQYLNEMERQFQPTLEDAMSRRISNLSIHPDDRDQPPEEGARSPVGLYGDKGQGERLCSAKRQGAGGRSPTSPVARWPGNSRAAGSPPSSPTRR